jgi:hypothetical protein
MTEHINLSVPKFSSDDSVIFKVDRKKEVKEKVQNFRSFAIGLDIGTDGHTICLNSHYFSMSTFYNILIKYELSKTLPIRISQNNYDDNLVSDIDFKPFAYDGPTVWYFKYDDIKCSIASHDYRLYIRVHDMILGVGEKIIKDLLHELESTYVNPLPTKHLVIYTVHKNYEQYSWTQNQNRIHRSMESIYINENIKETLIKGLKKFYSSSDLYDKYGVTWKRVHLFYGPPGTGKTSTVLALASIFNKNIAKLTLTPTLNSQQVETLFSLVPNDTFLIIEDADSLFTDRVANTSIDFSTILNCLDGLTTKRGLIVFMTTNHLEKLDSAFIRPGRVDIKVEFKLPTVEDIKNALNVLGSDYTHEHDEYIEKIKDNIPPIAELQKHLFDCIIEERKSMLN